MSDDRGLGSGAAGGPPPPPPPGAVPPPPGASPMPPPPPPGAVPPPPAGAPPAPPAPPGGPPPTATPGPASSGRTGIIIGAVVAALAVIGVGIFFLTRSDDDDEVSADTTEVSGPATSESESQSDVTIPDVPDFSIPDFSIPDFSIPDITFPDFTIPTFPDFSIPDGTPPDVVEGPIPPGVDSPDGLGDDPELNDLATECFDGVMQACDDLYDETVSDDAAEVYNVYGDTCAGRQPESTGVYCTVVFPGE